jgi:hypothetical protein
VGWPGACNVVLNMCCACACHCLLHMPRFEACDTAGSCLAKIFERLSDGDALSPTCAAAAADTASAAAAGT